MATTAAKRRERVDAAWTRLAGGIIDTERRTGRGRQIVHLSAWLRAEDGLDYRASINAARAQVDGV